MLTEGVFESGHGAQSGRRSLAYSPGQMLRASFVHIALVGRAQPELEQPREVHRGRSTPKSCWE